MVRINLRYAGLADARVSTDPLLKPHGKGFPKEEISIGAGDAGDWGFKNERLWGYLSRIALDPKYSVYPSRYRQGLLEAITHFEKKYRKSDYLPEHVILGAGVAGCFSSLHDALFEPGDEVVTITPSYYYWFPLDHAPYLGVRKVGSQALEKEDWRPDIDDLRKRITKKTKAVALTTPVNPTGKVYGEKELKEMINLAGEFNLPLICDEIEGILTYDGVESIATSRLANDVPCITVSSVSKAFGSPGWALGYMCFHDPRGRVAEIERTVKALAYSYGHSGHTLATPIMVAATKGLDEGWWIPDMVEKVQKQREFACKRLNGIEGVSCTKSRGTLWLFPKLDAIGKTWKTTEDFVVALWEEEGVGVQSGNSFGPGGFGHFRVTNLPPTETLGEAYDRLEHFLAKNVG